MGMVIGIKPEKIAEYKELHANCWPKILSMGSKRATSATTVFGCMRENNDSLVIGSIMEMTLQPTCRRWPMIRSPRNGGPSVSPVNHQWRLVRKENIGP